MGLRELLALEVKIKEEVENAILDEVKSSISAFGSVIDLKKLIHLGINPVYASSPITTGLLMYKELEKSRTTSIEELASIDSTAKKRIMDANINEGICFGNEIRAQAHPIVIVPGIFFAKGWTQEHYMALWKPVIINYSGIVCYNKEYHYSDGCVEELLIGIQNDKQLKVREGLKTLSLKDELIKIEDAMNHIEKIIGKTPKKLYSNYREICRLVQ
ncbi:hypothetical protein JW756_06065 [Candidatus Woesearchaeota archaeon]|nr:hypothetical protein [Candidatus Woesearchaeota archaeon]